MAMIFLHMRWKQNTNYIFKCTFIEYGRQCSDIGCLPSQVCTMAYESCPYGKTEGKECGRYPTCTKGSNGSNGSPNSAGSKLRRNKFDNKQKHHFKTHPNNAIGLWSKQM